MFIFKAFTTIHQSEGSQINGKEGEIQVSVAANETVGAEGQTIMIIQADEHLDASQVQNALNNANIHEVANIEVRICMKDYACVFFAGEFILYQRIVNG